jgi:hypothetical protein
MSIAERVGATRAGRLTLGACVSVALSVALIGLAVMAIVPVTPPDAAFAARTQVWRAIGPTPR